MSLKFLWVVEQNYNNEGWYPLVDYIRRNKRDALELKKSLETRKHNRFFIAVMLLFKKLYTGYANIFQRM